ncbi:MAG: nucleoside triphosphate pyrophosphohydrolase [Bacillota bacterium]|nr:nucleoside triphosphate pyrophosphohydrolase [Bacillota bacterium]
MTGTKDAPGQAQGRLTVVGLGPGGIEHVTVGVLHRLSLGGRLFVRTRRHPAVADLAAMGFTFESFDPLYETVPDYDTLYRIIAEQLVAAAQGRYEEVAPPPRERGEQPSALDREIVYAVPGHPTVAESSVRLAITLAQEAGIPVEVVAGLSWLDVAWADLLLDPTGLRNLVVVDALDATVPFRPDHHYLISHVYHPLVAGALKVRLLDAFPDDHPVVVFQGGLPGARRAEVPLHELDRLSWFDHLTSLWVPAVAGTGSDRLAGYPLDPLVEVMERLRGEDGCPWDKEQTHTSLKPYLIEEAYEVWDAIDDGDPEKLCEELGDLLLQIAFHAQIASEAEAFDLNDVVRGIVTKLVRRHPHVFADVTVAGVGEVIANWEEIKRGERGARGRRSALDGIPRHLPALLTAQKMQGKAARSGFEWPSFAAAVKKVWEEARELRRAREVAAARERLEEEVGDLLFAVVNVARFLHVNAEVALRRTVVKFARRFHRLEEIVREEGKTLSQLDPDQLLALWNRTKRSDR